MKNTSLSLTENRMLEKIKMEKLKKVRLTDVNTFLTCSLCCGYLIDAITINVCMHSCKLEKITFFERINDK